MKLCLNENWIPLSSVAPTSPTINPIVSHENRTNNDKESTPIEKMPNPALITLQSAGKNRRTTLKEESIETTVENQDNFVTKNYMYNVGT